MNIQRKELNGQDYALINSQSQLISDVQSALDLMMTVQYDHIQIAIIGDFSKYTSKALRDFIYESNQGRSVFFVASEEEAAQKLCRV